MVRKDALYDGIPNGEVVREVDDFDSSLKSDTAQRIVQRWIETATERAFPSPGFIESLQDGVLLCHLVKRIQPDSEIIRNIIEDPSPEEAQYVDGLQGYPCEVTVKTTSIVDSFLNDSKIYQERCVCQMLGTVGIGTFCFATHQTLIKITKINLGKFLRGCSNLGLSDWQLFDVQDLEPDDSVLIKSEDEVVQKVVRTLYWLGSIVHSMSYYKGPRLDVNKFQRQSNGDIIVKPQNEEYSNTSEMPHINGGVPQGNLIHLMNGYTNSTMINGDDVVEFSVNVRILGDEKRFGFSVMGGVDEGFPPRIDEISEGSPAAKTGLLVNDEILEVNGESVSHLTHTEVILNIHKCLRNRVIALKVRREKDSFSGLVNDTQGNVVSIGQSVNHNGKVDALTRNKLQRIMTEHENDPQFQYYNSDAESERSSDSRDYYGNGDVDGMVPNGPSWNKDYGNKNFGISEKNVLQSNLQKHKSLSTPLFDLTKLDSVEVDIGVGGQNDAWGEQNDAYDSDSDNNQAGEAGKELLFPCVEDLKSKLHTGNDRERISFVQHLFEQKQFQDATKVYTKIIELERSGRGPSAVRPVATNSRQLSVQLKHSLEVARDSQAAMELREILQSPNFEGLLLAHDRLAFREALPSEEEEEDEEPMETPQEPVLQPQRSVDEYSQLEDDSVKIVRIDKASDPLGATVKNENGTVVIGRIVKGGAADKCGLLQEGDEILEINGVYMKGKTVAEVCELLADMNGTLTFVLNPANRSKVPSDREVHVRAHFHYDPYEDELIPCRELGLAFRRGDILHVVNQEDPNWWQAWRAGDEGKNLAGLIPSKHFQQQKESMKHTVREKEPTYKEKRRCLCLKRKRRKKVVYNAQNSEEYAADEVLTYEEVALLQPNAQTKRPVVLIGPDKIGRRELRERLRHFSEERFSGATPHTSRPKKAEEVNDREYHFISRVAFQADIVALKFVEYGELGGHYYGTALSSIRRVISSGKYCILNFYCEALKTLKASDLKPYVVFISPPSYDQIKTLRRGKVDPFNPKVKDPFTDGELQEMIDKAREMEETFGHYFDYRIVNTDLERAFDELLQVIDKLETEAQWVPASWVNDRFAASF